MRHPVAQSSAVAPKRENGRTESPLRPTAPLQDARKEPAEGAMWVLSVEHRGRVR
jgi:hypothetical protein